MQPGISSVRRDPGTGALGVEFAQANSGAVQLGVYDIRGRLVRDFAGTYPAGKNVISWNGQDGSGRSVAAGIYLFKLQVGEATYSAKGVWIR